MINWASSSPLRGSGTLCLNTAHGGQEQFLSQQGAAAQCNSRSARPESGGSDLRIAKRARGHGFFGRQPRIFIWAALDAGQFPQGFTQRRIAQLREPGMQDERRVRNDGLAEYPDVLAAAHFNIAKQSGIVFGSQRRPMRGAEQSAPLINQPQGKAFAAHRPQSLREQSAADEPWAQLRVDRQLPQALRGLPLNGFDRTCTASSHSRDSTPRDRIALHVPPSAG